MTAGYVEFEFDLPGALLVRLIEILDDPEIAPMLPEIVKMIPEEQGVYQLFLDGVLVYIGKTDAEAGLAKRLARHGDKIQHRVGLDPARVSFKAVRLYVFTAMDLETELIRHYGGTKAVPWNGSGFGSNDPGRNRDTSTYKKEHYDSIFPIDIERPLHLDLDKAKVAADVFSTLKSHLPYTFRFHTHPPRSRRPHPDLRATVVSLSREEPLTAKGIISEVVGQLGPGWQAIKLPSHIILYKDDSRNIPYGVEIARSPEGT
jgi:hypothetical protein